MADALATWESAHGYTDADFRSALRRQIAAAWMRDRITASVPATAEQVHVKQILLYNASDAQQVLANLQAGTAFDDLAAQYDPVTKGDLGWFPRVICLTQPSKRRLLLSNPASIVQSFRMRLVIISCIWLNVTQPASSHRTPC